MRDLPGALKSIRIQYAALYDRNERSVTAHFGNLAFHDNYTGRFAIAPVYDMLPMLFAPQHDQIFAQIFNPPVPTSDTLRAWGRARTLAEDYWQMLTSDQRISAGFRAISAATLTTPQALPRTGAYAYQADI